MRLSPDKLAAHLRKTLAPLYLVFGEEILLAQESADAIRTAARRRGYSEREWVAVEPGFDWTTVRRLVTSLSLFAARRLLELRLGEEKFSEAGAKVLIDYAAHPVEEVVLLMTAGKIDWSTQKSRWFTALEQGGVVIPAMPIEVRHLPDWIERRMRERGLIPTAEAVVLFSERVEGNLLAAAQEIDRLALMATGQPVTAEMILAGVGDSARFNVYDFVDAALLGQPERVVRIGDGLRREGIEPILVNWALHREARLLAALAYARRQQQPLEPIFSSYKVWEKRRSVVQHALQRLSESECRDVLQSCARIDCMIKGVETGEAWDEVLTVGLRLAGITRFMMSGGR